MKSIKRILATALMLAMVFTLLGGSLSVSAAASVTCTTTTVVVDDDFAGKAEGTAVSATVAGTVYKGTLGTTAFATIQEAYDKLYAMEGHMILEQLIVQHPAVSAVYPNAINTVRTLTITKDGVAHIVATCWRIGNNGKHVDNFYNGGMVVPVDEKTGQVTQRAMDKEKNIYPVHPYTGNAIEGRSSRSMVKS